MANIEQIRKWCGGSWISLNDETTEIENIEIDSRNIPSPSNSVFVAIKANLRDGHSFISDAFRVGVRNFIVSQNISIDSLHLCNVIIVKDSVSAMQQIAAAHRKLFEIPVIGVTGSNGKTIVKEWLYHLLGDEYNAVRSPKSYNSQIGVPLSVWQIKQQHNIAIIEAGISQPGEMVKLEKVIQPTIGVFTNIGEAHSEGFLNTRQKINEKLILFRNANCIIYSLDHIELNECIIQYVHQVKAGISELPLKIFTWSFKKPADLKITKIDRQSEKTTITANYQNSESSITIPFSDDASIENAIHCWCVMLQLSVDEQTIKNGMGKLQPVSMRLELKQGINDCTVINDTYNSDLTSLQLALHYLDKQKQHSKHTVIMSDILEVGRRDLDLYDEVAGLLIKHNVQRFIGVGLGLYKNKTTFRKNKKLRSIFFKSTDDFLKHYHLITFDREAVLLKGARTFTFEKIAVLLEQKVHQTVMYVNLPAIRHNLDVFRKKLKQGVQTMAMVKAFGYGSGSYEIAAMLQNAGVDYLAVAYTDEGVSLRKSGIQMPIMVMSPDATSFDRMIAWKLEPEIYNFRTFDIFTQLSETLQIRDYPIHIKLDTGMHRLGFNASDMQILTDKISRYKSIRIASIFSHLAASESSEKDVFTANQAAMFRLMSDRIMSELSYKPLLHLCNSAGILRHASLHYDMVRLGIGLYGVDGSNELQSSLKQISVLKTVIAQIREVPIGDSVGYGHDTIAVEPMRIATICIGYADGYPRSLGNGYAHVLIHGKKANTIGSICMDMCMVDLTKIPEAREGDEVTVFGEAPSVSELAEWAGTIPYEIMTGISQRVKRVYVNEE